MMIHCTMWFYNMKVILLFGVLSTERSVRLEPFHSWLGLSNFFIPPFASHCFVSKSHRSGGVVTYLSFFSENSDFVLSKIGNVTTTKE